MEKKVQSAKEIFNTSNFLDRIKARKGYIHEEFQDFGFRLAVKLNDQAHKALYIKFAKELPRSVLEETAEFTLDYPITKGTRAKIFMWRLNQLCKEKNIKMPVRFKKVAKVKKQKPQLDFWAEGIK